MKSQVCEQIKTVNSHISNPHPLNDLTVGYHRKSCVQSFSAVDVTLDARHTRNTKPEN